MEDNKIIVLERKIGKIKTTIIPNTGKRLSNRDFIDKVKKRIIEMNEKNFVISYTLKEDDFHHITGAIIRYKPK